jgi:hypothetical protein
METVTVQGNFGFVRVTGPAVPWYIREVILALLELEALYVTGTSLLVETEFVAKSHVLRVPLPESFLLQEGIIANNKMTNTQSFKKLYFIIIKSHQQVENF